jgi:hypothetical protein
MWAQAVMVTKNTVGQVGEVRSQDFNHGRLRSHGHWHTRFADFLPQIFRR